MFSALPTPSDSVPTQPIRRPSRRRLGHRIAAVAALGSALALGGALASPAANAHVRVHPDSTDAGSFSALTFRVPNESDTAGTVILSVELPQDKPFLYVSGKPVAGWTMAITEASLPTPVESEGTTITKAPRTVTWTADRGRQIGPGQYDEFSISVGPLPGPGEVLLPAVQTYSDGTVVRWDDPARAGAEPEHPAPVLMVTAAGDSVAGSGSHGSAPQAGEAPPQPAVPAAESGADPTARWLGGGALAVSVVAAVLAGLGLARRTGTPGPTAGRG